jgi:hypothetical protein
LSFTTLFAVAVLQQTEANRFGVAFNVTFRRVFMFENKNDFAPRVQLLLASGKVQQEFNNNRFSFTFHPAC